MPTTRILIGIAGNLASGKDEVGRILAENHGYTHVSCSDYLRSYIELHRLGTPDRDTCTQVAHDLRVQNGASFLVDQCLDQYSDTERLALSGIYSPAEAIKIKEAGGHVLQVICRDERTRYERMVSRGHHRDSLSFEQFQEAYQKENTGDHSQQDIAAIAIMADYKLYNEGSLEELILEVAQHQSSIRTGVLHDVA